MLRASDESPRMFESDFLDFFSRVPFWVVPLVYVPLIGGFTLRGYALGTPISLLLGQLLAGVLVWTLLEYWLHRTLFHWVPAFSWGERFHFFLHGVHHQWHQDRFRLVMPPAASLALGVVIFGALAGLAALTSAWLAPSWKWAFFSGIMIGYLIYDMTHYYVHHGKPRSAFFKALRTHHLAHHHNPKFHDRKFGVSSTLWDHVFGTY